MNQLVNRYLIHCIGSIILFIWTLCHNWDFLTQYYKFLIQIFEVELNILHLWDGFIISKYPVDYLFANKNAQKNNNNDDKNSKE